MQVSDSSSRILAGLLEARTGQQLTMSRRWRIETALSALLRERGIHSLDELITILVMGKEPALVTQVVEALLNNETYFFRDRLPFDTLQAKLLPELRAARADSRKLTIWSAGCSTGQEAYTLAMMFAEDPLKWQGWTIDIVGTDVSSTAINRARSATYSQFEVQRGLAITQMIRWFEETPDGWRASEALRRKVRFNVHNLLEERPLGGDKGFDLVLCRNVLLYLSPEKRTQAFDRLADALAPDGALMLGAGETVIGQTERFASDRSTRGFYRLAEHQDADRCQDRVAQGA
jgi:chemotaxis protein methyltransferase CheR